MKIATWNVERLKHKRELPKITEICNEMAADILVLTETDSSLDLNYRSCFRTLSPIDAAVPYRSSENRVAIYTGCEFVEEYKTFDGQTAICVELSTNHGNLLVYGVVIGVFGNRHQNFFTDLSRIVSDIERLAATGKHLCVCGDFNCSFSDNYYYTKEGRTKLEKAFKENNLKLLTRKQPECIDHIAISRKFIGASAAGIEEWNRDKKLSDHKGIFVELTR